MECKQCTLNEISLQDFSSMHLLFYKSFIKVQPVCPILNSWTIYIKKKNVQTLLFTPKENVVSNVQL